MTFFWKSLVSLIAAMLLYLAMVAAFHLLNLPSTRAVFEGVALLLCLTVAGWFVFRTIWRQS